MSRRQPTIRRQPRYPAASWQFLFSNAAIAKYQINEEQSADVGATVT
jgi:hypothetical protein